MKGYPKRSEHAQKEGTEIRKGSLKQTKGAREGCLERRKGELKKEREEGRRKRTEDLPK